MYKRNTPRDVFMHLLMMATLYMGAINFLTIIFQGINKWVPDALSAYTRYNGESLRFAMSSLLIVFPVFLLTSWFLNKGYKKHVEARDFKLRKWLIYFTLFVAAIILIGDLIAVVNTFLSGEITLRFVLKVLSVFVVAGLIFGYYLWDIRRGNEIFKGNKLRLIAVGVSILVLGALVMGFFVSGSPMKERLRRFDDQRVQDLTQLQWQIVNFYQSKESVPENLGELKDDISGFVQPTDPETEAKYEYEKFDNTSFQLCATFNTDSEENEMPARGEYFGKYKSLQPGDTWEHDSGRFCFERVIDPDLYPQFEKPKPVKVE